MVLLALRWGMHNTAILLDSECGKNVAGPRLVAIGLSHMVIVAVHGSVIVEFAHVSDLSFSRS